MTDPTFRDFDAAWAETRRPLHARILGADYELPATPPATLMLRLEALTRTMAGDDLSPADMREFLEAAFGAAAVTAWLDGGMEFGQLEDILSWVFNCWQLDPTDTDAGPGEAPAPSGASTSSG